MAAAGAVVVAGKGCDGHLAAPDLRLFLGVFMAAIAADSYVTLHYRMALVVDGVEQELVNTFPLKPATLQMGVGQWSPYLEQCLMGLEDGVDARFDLAPDQAYGPHLSDLVRRVTRDQLQELAQPGWVAQAGESIHIQNDAGLSHRGTLVDISAESALVDFNHPLAGMPLRLQVQVIGVL
jgi:FKBP-type peptidyl-prolyl cis-trans isomerase SlpA